MSFVGDVFDGITGTTAADAATEAADTQRDTSIKALQLTEAATEQGLGFLEPFSGLGQQGVEQASFLTNPQQQFDFLQNNPLFAASLGNANTQTQNLAAARGRLSAGDTLQQLSNNVLLSASPLIQDQKRSIGDLLNFGSGIATTQANTAINQGTNVANLVTNAGAAQAAGQVGAANAQTQGAQNLLTTALLAGGIFSDLCLKKDKLKVGTENGFNVYTWTWNSLANALGLFGMSRGVMAQEVQRLRPDAVININGFLAVDYDLIGVSDAH